MSFLQWNKFWRRGAVPQRDRVRPRCFSCEPLESRQMLTLLGVVPTLPFVTYDSGGTIAYTATSNALDVNATPLSFDDAVGAPPPRGITVPRGVSLHLQVDNSGNLIGGVAGDDLVISGTVTPTGLAVDTVSGVLLTGEVLGFGYLESGATDQYDFRFAVTGGLLAGYWAGHDIGIKLSSENSSFHDDFGVDFGGGAKGNIGNIAPLPPPVMALIGGHKFEDHNGNGVQDVGDQGLAGWHILVNGVDSATTGAGGVWGATVNAPGTYTITEVTQTGWTETGTLSYTVVVAANGDITSGTASDNDFLNFENYCIAVHKFVDINSDGIENGGDGGVAGITINIDTNGDTVPDYSGTTDADGNFEVCDIGPGAVVVTEDLSQSAFTWENVSSGNTSFTGSSGVDQATSFGNILCNAGIAKTIGFWANNADKTLGQILTLNNDLDAGGITNALYGTSGFATGVNEFISFKAFRSWILGASAKNMSYMLSAQLAGAALNVGSGMASAYTLVTVTAGQDALITSATTFVDGKYVVEINDIIAEANAALTLVETPENRAYLEALKTILDNFNNMTNWYDSPLC